MALASSGNLNVELCSPIVDIIGCVLSSKRWYMQPPNSISRIEPNLDKRGNGFNWSGERMSSDVFARRTAAEI